MSNRRRSVLFNSFYPAYLRSPAWFARRDRWFTEQQTRGIPLSCAGCGRTADKQHLELHHLAYAGKILLARGRWSALEEHDDLLPLHPYCHELLHRLIDRDQVLARNRSRRDATWIALHRLRPILTPTREEGKAS